MTHHEKTTELIGLIDTLCKLDFAKDKKYIDNCIARLNKIYANGYRHTYSDIFYKIQQIISDESQPEVLEVLGENLNVLGNRINELAEINIEDANYKNTALGFNKFADHIKLEIGRYNFIKSRFENNREAATSGSNDYISDELKQDIDKIEVIEKAVYDMRPTVTQAQKQLDGLDAKLERNKISSITTLTIFSAVILAFSGGISFVASVFSSIAAATPYRLIFIISLTGFILFNTLFALLYIVGKMSGRSIGTRCKYLSTDNNNNYSERYCGDGVCDNQCASVSIACKIWHKYSYVLAVNVVLLGLMYYDYIIWALRPSVPFLSYSCRQNLIFLSPVFAIIAVLLTNHLKKYIQRRRIVLSLKCETISNIYNPKESIGLFSYLTTMGSLFGQKQKNHESELRSIINTKSGKDRLSKIDEYIEDNMLTAEVLANTISSHQHRKNKKKWAALKSQIESEKLAVLQQLITL